MDEIEPVRYEPSFLTIFPRSDKDDLGLNITVQGTVALPKSQRPEDAMQQVRNLLDSAASPCFFCQLSNAGLCNRLAPFTHEKKEGGMSSRVQVTATAHVKNVFFDYAHQGHRVSASKTEGGELMLQLRDYVLPCTSSGTMMPATTGIFVPDSHRSTRS